MIATPKGGTHVAGFEQGLLKSLRTRYGQRQAAQGRGRQGREGRRPRGPDRRSDGSAGEPQFEGQTKEVLGTSAVRGIVARVVEQRLTACLPAPSAATRTQAAAVAGEGRRRGQGASRRPAAQGNGRRKNALETSALPTKLVDCRSGALDRSELFIVEGDSALGTGKAARDAEYQALLPIRGKILNVQKASVGDMLHNAECAAILQVVGAGSGRSFELSQTRYGKIILMVDADVDGAHIRTLLITLFFRYMRPLVEAGRLFAAVPPLHRIELTSARTGQDRYIYTYTDAELTRTLRDLDRKGVRYKQPPHGTRGWVRWIRTSSPIPRWIPGTGGCAGSPRPMPNRPTLSSNC